jgi:hypothetical protein
VLHVLSKALCYDVLCLLCCLSLMVCGYCSAQVTRERIRQIEARAIRMLRAKQAQLDSISDHAEGKKSRLAARSAGGAVKKKQ